MLRTLRRCLPGPSGDLERRSLWNRRSNVASGAASKLAEQLAGPNLVLPWLFQLIGAPVWMLGFLLPVKQGFSLLPQLLVAGQIRRFSVRKWVWVGAACLQVFCLLLMIPAILWLPPAAAGLVVLALLALFSVASGTASVAFQEVLGRTVVKGRRGRLLAQRALLGGLLTTLGGLLLNRLPLASQLQPLLWLIFLAALLWVLAALLFALIAERPEAVAPARNLLAEVRAGYDHYRQVPGFRRFLQVRGLLLAVELVTPFYVLHATQVLQLQITDLGLLVSMVGFAQLASSPFWGRMADATSRQVLLRSGQLAAGATLLAIALTFLPVDSLRYAGYLLVFLTIGLAEAGIRLGRKTYLVDAAPAEERATFLAFSNSLTGLLVMLSGLAGLLAQWLGATSVLLLFALLLGGGILACRKLPEAGAMLVA